MKVKTLAALLAMLSAVSWARDWRAVRDEADRNLPPNVKWYLEQREKKDWFLQSGPFAEHLRQPESSGVRLVGKWGRGPANKVTGRDSLVFMSLGSEVAIFNAADGHNPRVIAEIQCRNMTGRLCLKDSLLFVGSQGPVEVYSVANPASPHFIACGPVVAPDISVQDSLVYALGSDSLFIFNAANPANWQRRGAMRDSGYCLNVADGFAYLGSRWGLYIDDISDPANPRRASMLGGTNAIGASWTEGGYCYYTEEYPNSSFVIADVSDPYHPSEVARLTGIDGWDIYKLSFFLYLPSFRIMDVSQPSSPTTISTLTVVGYLNGVWVRSPYSFAFIGAGHGGLNSVNIADPVHPVSGASVACASEAHDVFVSENSGYVADFLAGMQVVDVHDHSNPAQAGSYDSIGDNPVAEAVTARGDSLAFLLTQIWLPDGLRVLDVSDPGNPRLAATCRTGDGEAIVLRDTLAYVAEDYKLEIFSIANPRAPRLVGSCALPNASSDLWLVDTLAYVGSLPTQIINVRNPGDPVSVGNINQGPMGICVKDSFAYLAVNYGGLEVWNVADPTATYLVGTVSYPRGFSVRVADSLLYFGGLDLRVLRLDDPAHPAEVGQYSTTGRVYRIDYSAPYIYTACHEAGVSILALAGQQGIAEVADASRRTPGLALFPNPTSGDWLRLSAPGRPTVGSRIKCYGSSGRVVMDVPVSNEARNGCWQQRVEVGNLPAGCYFVSLCSPSGSERQKFVKTRER